MHHQGDLTDAGQWSSTIHGSHLDWVGACPKTIEPYGVITGRIGMLRAFLNAILKDDSGRITVV